MTRAYPFGWGLPEGLPHEVLDLGRRPCAARAGDLAAALGRPPLSRPAGIPLLGGAVLEEQLGAGSDFLESNVEDDLRRCRKDAAAAAGRRARILLGFDKAGIGKQADAVARVASALQGVAGQRGVEFGDRLAGAGVLAGHVMTGDALELVPHLATGGRRGGGVGGLAVHGLTVGVAEAEGGAGLDVADRFHGRGLPVRGLGQGGAGTDEKHSKGERETYFHTRTPFGLLGEP